MHFKFVYRPRRGKARIKNNVVHCALLGTVERNAIFEVGRKISLSSSCLCLLSIHMTPHLVSSHLDMVLKS